MEEACLKEAGAGTVGARRVAVAAVWLPRQLAEVLSGGSAVNLEQVGLAVAALEVGVLANGWEWALRRGEALGGERRWEAGWGAISLELLRVLLLLPHWSDRLGTAAGCGGMEGGSAPPIGGGGGGGAAPGSGFPASFLQRQQPAPPVGGFGAGDESAMVDSLISQFSEINTAFDPEATLRRFVEVTSLPDAQARELLTSAPHGPLLRPPSLPAAASRGVVTRLNRDSGCAASCLLPSATAAHGGDLRAAMAAFVASQARSTTSSSFEADLDDSDDSDDDSDDEPKIRPVYRTQSGRGIRMRAADRAYAPVARSHPLPAATARAPVGSRLTSTAVCILAARPCGSSAVGLTALLRRTGGLHDPQLRARSLRRCVPRLAFATPCAAVRGSRRAQLLVRHLTQRFPSALLPGAYACSGRCAFLQRLR